MTWVSFALCINTVRLLVGLYGNNSVVGTGIETRLHL